MPHTCVCGQALCRCVCGPCVHVCVGEYTYAVCRCDGVQEASLTRPCTGSSRPGLSFSLSDNGSTSCPLPPSQAPSQPLFPLLGAKGWGGEGKAEALWEFTWNSRHSAFQGSGRRLKHSSQRGAEGTVECVHVGAGLSVLGGSGAGGICRTENRAWVASPLGLESGQQPGLALRGLPQDGPAQGTPGTRTPARGPAVRAGHGGALGSQTQL